MVLRLADISPLNMRQCAAAAASEYLSKTENYELISTAVSVCARWMTVELKNARH